MKWANLIPLLIFTALLLGAVLLVRPAARRRRHEAWERAGLLPHQVDPEGTAHEQLDRERHDRDQGTSTDEPNRPD